VLANNIGKLMSFSLSVITTLLIGALVWLGMIFQPVTESGIFEKYASYNLSAEQTSDAAYSMISFGRKETSTYFQLDDPALVVGEDAAKSSIAVQEKSERRPLQLAASEAVVSPKKNKTTSIAQNIVGISRTINLSAIDKVWQDFEANTELSKQLSSETYTIFVVYSDLNADYSRAKVSMGFLDSSMSGTKIPLPGGKKVSLLARGQHSADKIYKAWNNIDYNKFVKSVLERHDYIGTDEKVSVSVIYQ